MFWLRSVVRLVLVLVALVLLTSNLFADVWKITSSDKKSSWTVTREDVSTRNGKESVWKITQTEPAAPAEVKTKTETKSKTVTESTSAPAASVMQSCENGQCSVVTSRRSRRGR